jgi:hypothetical protein
MAVTDDIAVQSAAADVVSAARALFEEARRRRRRRHLWLAAAIVLVGGSVAGTLVTVGSHSPSRPTPAATTARAEGVRSIRSLTFAGSFAPQQVVSAAGRIWLVGSTEPEDRHCAIEEIDPVSLRTTTFSIPACGTYVAVGKGRIFLADGVFTGATDTTAFHIESFDVATGTAVVMAPVAIATTGTGYAHMALTFAGGSLWLNPWSAKVLEISPPTGAVIRTITGTAFSDGGHPVIAAAARGAWLTGGADSPLVIDRLEPLSTTPVVVYRGSGPSSILWLSTVGNRMWAEVGTYGDGGIVVATRLLAFTTSGRKVLETPPERLGDLPVVGAGGQLWTVGGGSTRCTGPQRLWRIDRRTGTSVAVATLPSPVVPCLVATDGSEIAAVGDHVFVLDPTETSGPGSVLYRITS